MGFRALSGVISSLNFSLSGSIKKKKNKPALKETPAPLAPAKKLKKEMSKLSMEIVEDDSELMRRSGRTKRFEAELEAERDVKRRALRFSDEAFILLFHQNEDFTLDWKQDHIVGTCMLLEKAYLRLTTVPFFLTLEARALCGSSSSCSQGVAFAGPPQLRVLQGLRLRLRAAQVNKAGFNCAGDTQ